MVMINWRQSPRLALHVPLWIRRMDFSKTPSQRAEALNFPASRLCMLTGLPFLLGAILETFLRMPAEIMGGIKRECAARAGWFAWGSRRWSMNTLCPRGGLQPARPSSEWPREPSVQRGTQSERSLKIRCKDAR